MADVTLSQLIGAAAVIALRDGFLDTQTAQVAALAAQLASGDITLRQWETAMRALLKATLGTSYVFGRGGLDRMTATDWSALAGLVVAQYGFLNDFAGDIATGTLSVAAISARATMYVGAGTGAYERAAATAMDVVLPEYPGDSCRGMSNCRCFWNLVQQDDGSIEASWVCENDQNSCQPCIDNASQYNPFVISGEGE